MLEIEPYFIETAERMRQESQTSESARLVAEVAEFPINGLSDDDIRSIANHPVQKLILACLVRIDVDARKTAANKEKKPLNSFSDVEKATDAVVRFYRNQDLQSGLQGVQEDHLGRAHNFLPEMARDVSKVAESAADFYRGTNRKRLLVFAKAKLIQTQQMLEEGDPVRALIGIESQLLGEYLNEKVNESQLLEDMYQVARGSKHNPHRVATVAAWVQAYGERSNNSELIKKANNMFEAYVSGKDWDFVLSDAREKPDLKRKRAKFFGLAGPIVISPPRRRKLISDLVNK